MTEGGGGISYRKGPVTEQKKALPFSSRVFSRRGSLRVAKLKMSFCADRRPALENVLGKGGDQALHWDEELRRKQGVKWSLGGVRFVTKNEIYYK